MQDLENHEQLVCTNHDFVHKSEVDPPPPPNVKSFGKLQLGCDLCINQKSILILDKSTLNCCQNDTRF